MEIQETGTRIRKIESEKGLYKALSIIISRAELETSSPNLFNMVESEINHIFHVALGDNIIDRLPHIRISCEEELKLFADELLERKNSLYKPIKPFKLTELSGRTLRIYVAHDNGVSVVAGRDLDNGCVYILETKGKHDDPQQNSFVENTEHGPINLNEEKMDKLPIRIPLPDTLVQIWEMQHELNCMIGRDTINDPKKELWGMDFILGMEQEIAELKDCYNWKWWSKHHTKSEKNSVIDMQNAKVEYVDILHFFICIGQTLGFTPNELVRIYKQKMKINQQRQRDGYDSTNKTEDDNRSIK